MANTTNLNLVKPAGTDKALVSVLNSNSDKIDAFAGTTNQALSNKQDYNPTTAADLHAITTRSKLISGKWVGNSTANAPINNNQGSFLFYASSDNYQTIVAMDDMGRVYTQGKVNGTWSDWDQLATNELGTASIHINRSSLGSFTFSGLNAINDSTIFKHGLLVWGTGSSDANVGMSIVFVNTDGTVAIKNVTGTGRTFTGQVNSDGSLTITPSAVMYGGLKLIWLT